ncbi:MAG: hypothetical protein WA724_03075 [Candidatus Dormiibacterota bacterium]
MNSLGTKSVVVLARGDLSSDDAALAVRVALALPLAGLAVRLLLVDAASALGLSALPDLGPWSSGLVREMDALLTDEEVPVLVEQESLAQLGLAGQALRPGVATVPRSQVAAICAAADSCLVL